MNRARVASLIGLASFLVLILVAPAPVLAGAPLQLTTNTVADSGADAFVDVSGNVHVVYERDSTIYYRAKTEEGWSDEEMVAVGVGPAVGADASGNAQVVFRDMGVAKHMTRVEGVWSAPAVIGPATLVDLAVTPDGVAHVVYLGNFETSDSYQEIGYTNNALGAFPVDPVRVWDSYYWYDGGGKDARYYSGPVVATDGVGHVAVGYQVHALQGAIGWTDHTYSSSRLLPGNRLRRGARRAREAPTPTRGATRSPWPTAIRPTSSTARRWAWSTVARGHRSPCSAGSSFTLDLSPGTLHVGYVDAAGGIGYVAATGSTFGDPIVLDANTSGRNPVVRTAGAGVIVAYEAVDNGDYEVWLAKTTNEAPVLEAVGDQTVDEGEVLSFTVAATDEDDDPLTYEAGNLPEGSTFDTDTQTFTWTPGYDQAGAHADIEFSVSDGTKHGLRDDHHHRRTT